MALNLSFNKLTWEAAEPDFPDETNTGHLTATGSLIAVPGTATSGTGWAWNGDGVVISGAATTFSGYNVSGFVSFAATADGSTVSDCLITVDGDDTYGVYFDGSDGCTLEDCTLVGPNDGTSGGLNMVWIDTAPNSIVQRCDISGGQRGFFLGGVSGLIEDNYYHDGQINDDGRGIQMFGSNACDDTWIIHNNIVMDTDSYSACLIGLSINLKIDGNRFINSDYALSIANDSSNEYTNNRIGGWDVSATDINASGTGNATWTNNVNDADDTPISAP